MTTRYTFQRGETIQLALDAMTGSTGDVSLVTAHMRKLLPGKMELQPTAPIAANFDVTTRAATEALPAGWTLTIPAPTSVELEGGNYLVDAQLMVNAGIITTDSVQITIMEPATV